MTRTSGNQTVHLAVGVLQNSPAACIPLGSFPSMFGYDEGLIIVVQREARQLFWRLNINAIAKGNLHLVKTPSTTFSFLPGAIQL